MPKITWSNGQQDTARSWQALLDKVRERQYREYSEEAFRVEMYKRALLWSGVEIDAGAKPKRFFIELQWAKLIKIEKEAESHVRDCWSS